MAGERQSDMEGEFSRFPANSPWARGDGGWFRRGFGLGWAGILQDCLCHLLKEGFADSSGAEQAAEKLDVLKGHGFSRAVSAAKSTGL